MWGGGIRCPAGDAGVWKLTDRIRLLSHPGGQETGESVALESV